MKTPLPPPDFRELLDQTATSSRLSEIISIGVGPMQNGEYRHWDTVRHLDPPSDLSHEEWWVGIKMARMPLLQSLPVADKEGRPFRYALPGPIQEMLHKVDRDASGRIEISEQVTNPETRDRYIVNSLIEEAITSSQLEGASTTTEQAKEMIRTGRPPADRSEKMILNNYEAMRFVQENKDKEVTPSRVFTLHRIVTKDTLDDPDTAGRFRKDSDRIVITDQFNNILHKPPPADELPERLDAMCRFANGETPEEFVHPVIRAIVLHFWLAYDHPFVDGNGRTARALFYRSMLSQDYWLSAYLSISSILRKAPAQYSRSFLHSETDGNDLTYFIDYQLQVIRRAIGDLHDYLKRKVREVQRVERLMRQTGELNHRQLALLSHALKHPRGKYTIDSHRRSHDVVYETARRDLTELADEGLLQRKKVGRRYEFRRPGDLEARLKEFGEAA